MAVEVGWRQCVKCGEFVFSTPAGGCAGGGSHQFENAFIGIFDSIPEFTNLFGLQTAGGWRRCKFCQALFFTGPLQVSPGPVNFKPGSPTCPAIGGNGHHDGSGSPAYLIITKLPDASMGARQWVRAGWHRCGKCSALFFAGRLTEGGRCVTDGKPHAAAGDPLFVCAERLARLPLPTKAGVGMTVNLKVDTKKVWGWMVASECTWVAASETRLSVQSKWGQGIFAALDFEMVDGPQCAMIIDMGGDKITEILGITVDDTHVDPISVRQTIGCISVDGRDDPDVEFAPDRNNGQILELPIGKLFPKNNNRVRLSLNVPVSGLTDFELETQ